MYQLREKGLARGVAASKVLSSEARMKILNILLNKKGKDICVKEIADAIGLSHSATSHQLAKLQDMGVVVPSRMGQTMCYSMTKSALAQTLSRIIQQILK